MKMIQPSISIFDIPNYLKKMLFILIFLILAQITFDILTLTTFKMTECSFLLIDPNSAPLQWYEGIISQLGFLFIPILLLMIFKIIHTKKTVLVSKTVLNTAIMFILYLLTSFISILIYLGIGYPLDNNLNLLIWGPLIMGVVAFTKIHNTFKNFLNFHGAYILALPFYAYVRLLAQIIIYISGELVYSIANPINWVAYILQLLSLFVFSIGLAKNAYYNNQFRIVTPDVKYVNYLLTLKQDREKA